jgi:hypothetical protein
MGDKQGSPSVRYFPAIRQQFEIPLDHTRKPIRFDPANASKHCKAGFDALWRMVE